MPSRSRSRSSSGSCSKSPERSVSPQKTKINSKNNANNATSKGKRIWVGGLRMGSTEDDLHDYFGKFGKIINIKLRSSQVDVFAFVEYSDSSAAQEAIDEMDQKTVRGHRVKVHWAQEKAVTDQQKNRKKHQLWVGHLSSKTTKNDLYTLFEEFGPVTELLLRNNSRQEYFAFIEFEKKLDADKAICALHGQMYGKHKLRVEWTTGVKHTDRERTNTIKKDYYNGGRSKGGRRSRSPRNSRYDDRCNDRYDDRHNDRYNDRRDDYRHERRRDDRRDRGRYDDRDNRYNDHRHDRFQGGRY